MIQGELEEWKGSVAEGEGKGWKAQAERDSELCKGRQRGKHPKGGTEREPGGVE